MNPQLLPCPFCGSKAITNSDDWALGAKYFKIMCSSKCDVYFSEKTQELAIERWNMRAGVGEKAERQTWRVDNPPPETDILIKFWANGQVIVRVGDANRAGEFGIYGTIYPDRIIGWMPIPE